MRAFGPLREDRRMGGLGESRRAAGRGKGACLGMGEGRLAARTRGVRPQAPAFELMRAGGRCAIAPARRLDRAQGFNRDPRARLAVGRPESAAAT